MTTHYDAIVIGIGSMGSSACYHLAKRGLSVLGIEQFDITHESGSHAGQSRIIRKAYFEHADYVPLLQRAYENWYELEKETGEQLYFRTGLMYTGNPGHAIMKGVKFSADTFGISLENVSRADAEKRFPQFQFPEDYEILFEPDAGFVTPEKTILLYTSLAKKLGAVIHTGEKLFNWENIKDGVMVKTDSGTYYCKKLIITAGAWSGKLIPELSEKIKASRQFVAWISPAKERGLGQGEMPCWMIADNNKPGCYYGFPMLDTEKFGEPRGLKLAHHYIAAYTDPDLVNRETNENDIIDLQYSLKKYLPGVFESVLHSKICLYGNSPDEHFIFDKLPGHEERVIIACGFSGHGFKFVPVVGELVADLVINGNTELPAGFLKLDRFNN